MKFLGLKKNWKQWLSLLCLCIGGGTIYKLPYIRDVFYVQFQEAFGATNTQMGLMMTVYAVACALCFLPGGWLTDLVPAKYLVSLGLFTTGATGRLHPLDGRCSAGAGHLRYYHDAPLLGSHV